MTMTMTSLVELIIILIIVVLFFFFSPFPGCKCENGDNYLIKQASSFTVDLFLQLINVFECTEYSMYCTHSCITTAACCTVQGWTD